jgi:hypothetical protein
MCPATCAGQCGGLNTATTIAVTTPTTTTTDTTDTTTSTTTTACADPNCLYGYYWDSVMCTCSCNKDVGSAFTGPRCENVDCTLAVDQDPGFCSVIACADQTEKQTCPVTCGVCPASG